MLSLEVLRPLVRAAWGPDTCDPHALESWRPDNPARGQCGVTALVVQDLLGGDLVLGHVHVGQTKVGNHYWNRLPDGGDVDLTADQFHPDEVVTGAQVQQRPPDAPRRCREQYELLRERVLTALTAADAEEGAAADLGGRRLPAGLSTAVRLPCRSAAAPFDLGVRGSRGASPRTGRSKMAKYMLILRGTDESVAKMMDTPFEQMLETMGRFNEEMIRAGVLVAAEGLDDPSQGVVVDFSGETPVVTDGPYGETKELFGGFYLIEVASKQEAVEWAKRLPAVAGTKCEIRRVPSIDEFPQDNEWIIRERAWRERTGQL